MKTGDVFVVFRGRYPSLVCYIDAVLPNGEWRCWVINGAWEFIMDPRTGDAAWSSPSGRGSNSDTFQWVPLNDLPGVPDSGNYDELFMQILSSGFYPGHRNLWVFIRGLAHVWKRRFNRLVEACRAFREVLLDRATVRSNVTRASDDVPF